VEERALDDKTVTQQVFNSNKNLLPLLPTHPSLPDPMTLSQRFLLAAGQRNINAHVAMTRGAHDRTCVEILDRAEVLPRVQLK